MATNKNAIAVCDTCGFVYPHRVMRMNSYGMLVCPQDFEGRYDLKNSPLNKIPNVRDDPAIKNPRADYLGGRGVMWNKNTTWITTNPTTLAETKHTTKWDDANRSWNTI